MQRRGRNSSKAALPLHGDPARDWAVRNLYDRGDGNGEWTPGYPSCVRQTCFSPSITQISQEGPLWLAGRKEKGRQIRISKGINIIWCVCQDFNRKFAPNLCKYPTSGSSTTRLWAPSVLQVPNPYLPSSAVSSSCTFPRASQEPVPAAIEDAQIIGQAPCARRNHKLEL